MIAVEVKDVSKKYKLYRKPAHRFAEWMTASRKKMHEEFWALKDVSFQLEKGKAMGIVGPNGAGKSTLLKVITGTTSPTTGTFASIGRVASLLELGAGFHPEFTGRQNLRMNAKMLGLTDEEIDDRMDEIVRFAELGPFIDQPVRTYSSGMYVRLGFAIASSVRPDVLIVDEALSVGDAYFQRKSLDRIKYFRDHGVTILFVSHDLSIVRRFCDYALWLNEGRVQNVGEAGKVIKSYELWEKKKEEINLGVEYDLNEEAVPDGSGAEVEERKKKLRVLGSTWGSGEVKITRVEMLDRDGKPKWTFNTGEPVTIRYHYYAFQEVPNPIFGLNIHRLDGVYVFGTNNYNIHPSPLTDLKVGEGYVDFHIGELNLHCGTFFLTANVYLKPDEPFWSEPADFHHQMYEFKVWSGQPQHGLIPLEGGWHVGSDAQVSGPVIPDQLDFSAEAVTNYLLDGWHEIERSGDEEDAFSFVWCDGQASFLINIPRQATEICLDLHGNQLAEEEGQTVDLFLDGLPLGSVTIREGYQVYSLAVPEESKGKTVRGEIVSKQVWTPREVFEANDDRKLSVAVRGIWTQ